MEKNQNKKKKSPLPGLIFPNNKAHPIPGTCTLHAGDSPFLVIHGEKIQHECVPHTHTLR